MDFYFNYGSSGDKSKPMGIYLNNKNKYFKSDWKMSENKGDNQEDNKDDNLN